MPDRSTTALEWGADWWGADWPLNCPPSDAIPCNGVLFRLIRAPNDWQPAIVRGSHLDKSDCIRRALSCAVSVESLRAVKSLNRGIYEGGTIVKGELQAGHGKMKATGHPGHRSVWIRAQYWDSRETLFAPV